jgi:hypothetical protein
MSKNIKNSQSKKSSAKNKSAPVITSVYVVSKPITEIGHSSTRTLTFGNKSSDLTKDSFGVALKRASRRVS